MHKIWHDEAWADYLYWQTQDKKTLKKSTILSKILTEMVINVQEDRKRFPVIFPGSGA